MGKIDDMRRQREALHAQAAARAAARGEAPAAEPPATIAVETEPTVRVAAAPSPSMTRRKPAADEEGVCSVCGKVRAVQGGLVASHQKGLGKFCPGSRKPPA